MTVTPDGLLSEPVSSFVTLLSQSAAFQTETGAANAAAALAFITVGIESDDGSAPLVVVDSGDQINITQIAQPSYFQWANSVFLLFRFAVTEAISQDAYYDFMNVVGNILEDIVEASGAGGVCNITSIEKVGGPMREDEDEAAAGLKYYEISFNVRFGL